MFIIDTSVSNLAAASAAVSNVVNASFFTARLARRSFDSTWIVGGEIVMNVVENVRYSFGSKARDNLSGDHHHWVGTLAVTNYRLVLHSHITHTKSAGTRHEIR